MSEHHHHHHHGHDESYHHSSISYEIQRGLIYQFLFASLVFSTIFLIISVLMPMHRFFKIIVSKIFNIKFNFKGMNLTIYSVIIVWIVFCTGLFAFIKMQISQFDSINPHESFSTRLYKHKNKCMLESELWMLAIIAVEWLTIYKYFKLLDYRLTKEHDLKVLQEAKKSN